MPINESSVLVRLRLLGGARFAAETRADAAALRGLKTESLATSGRLGGLRSKVGGAGAAIYGATKVVGGAALAVGALGVGAFKMASNFQSAMEMVHTQAGETQKRTDMLSKSILSLARGGRFAQGPTDLANGLYRLEGAGIRGTKALNALKAASDLAAVGNADVESTAKTLAQTWFSGIKGAGNFRAVVGELNATVGAGDLRLTQLIDALGTGLLPVAAQAHLSLRDITGVLALFGDETSNVSGWAAQFSTALHFLTNPTTKAEKALERLGVGNDRLSRDMRKPQGLLVALRDLRGHLAKLPGGFKGIAAQRELGDILPGGRGRVMKVLLGQLDRYQGKLRQVGRTTGNFGDSVAKTQETSAYRIHRAWTQIQATMITVGQKLQPVGASILTGVSKVLAPKTLDALKSGFQTPELGTVGFGGMQKFAAGVGVIAAKIVRVVKPLGRNFINAFKPAAPFLHNVLIPLLKGLAVGVIGSVIFAVKALTIVIKVVATVLGFLGKILRPFRSLFFGIGVVIGFLASGPILKLLEGIGKIGMVFRLLRIPIELANAAFRGVFRLVGVGARVFLRALSWVQRFVGTFERAPARVIRAALNIVGGIIHGIESLPGRMGRIAGRGIGAIVGKFGGLAGRLFSAAGRIGRAIVNGIVSAIKAMPGAIIGAISSIVPGPIKSVLKKAGGVPGDIAGLFHAQGGVVRTPIAIVGERGPEAIAAPQGSRVLTAAETRGALRSGRAMAAAPNQYINLAVNLSGKQIHTEVVRVEQRQLEAM